MKRSEMLESITSELNGNFLVAETILTMIEDLGMLPPNGTWEEESYNDQSISKLTKRRVRSALNTIYDFMDVENEDVSKEDYEIVEKLRELLVLLDT